MTALLTPPATAPTPPPATSPRPFVWTVPLFHQLGDMGWFEGRRASLIHGVIIEEGAMNPPHANAGEKTEEVIRSVFGPGWRVRVQKPLVLGLTIDPEPDVAVVRGAPGGSPDHPTSAEMVIEIADSSLAYDTTTKAELYATAGIQEYWVLDVDGRQLHVFRTPATLPQGLAATAYLSHTTHGPSETVSPLAAPTATVRVADLLP